MRITPFQLAKRAAEGLADSLGQGAAAGATPPLKPAAAPSVLKPPAGRRPEPAVYPTGPPPQAGSADGYAAMPAQPMSPLTLPPVRTGTLGDSPRAPWQGPQREDRYAHPREVPDFPRSGPGAMPVAQATRPTPIEKAWSRFQATRQHSVAPSGWQPSAPNTGFIPEAAPADDTVSRMPWIHGVPGVSEPLRPPSWPPLRRLLPRPRPLPPGPIYPQGPVKESSIKQSLAQVTSPTGTAPAPLPPSPAVTRLGDPYQPAPAAPVVPPAPPAAPSAQNSWAQGLGSVAGALTPLLAKGVGQHAGLPGLFALHDARHGFSNLSTLFGRNPATSGANNPTTLFHGGTATGGEVGAAREAGVDLPKGWTGGTASAGLDRGGIGAPGGGGSGKPAGSGSAGTAKPAGGRPAGGTSKAAAWGRQAAAQAARIALAAPS